MWDVVGRFWKFSAAAATLFVIMLVVIRGLFQDTSLAPPAGDDTKIAGVESSDNVPDAGSSAASSQTPAETFLNDIKTVPPNQWSVLTTAALEATDYGNWDDFRVGSPIVMKDARASQYRMWYVGCRLTGAEHGCGIGHATSTDGVNWTRSSSPVFSPPDLPTPNWLSAVALVKRANEYLMWYSVDADPFAERPRGTLHMARSADGLVWENVGQVLTTASDRSRAIKHTVHDDGHMLHLWYFESPADRGDESLAHYTSTDGKIWTQAGGDTFEGRAGSVGRPWVTSDRRGGFRALLVDYREGASLRWLTSPDGTTWTADEIERDVRVTSDGWSIVAATGLEDTTGLWLWLSRIPQGRRAAESIGVAFKKGGAS
jgi:hypothetical protein